MFYWNYSTYIQILGHKVFKIKLNLKKKKTNL